MALKKKKKQAKPQLDRAQDKQRKQRRLAAGLGAVLVLVLVYEVPHTMKLMNQKAKAPVVTASGAPAAANPSDSGTASASAPPSTTPIASSPTPSVSSLASSGLVSSVQVKADPGQLTDFAHFASKDPFEAQIVKPGAASGSSSGGGGTSSPTTPNPPTATTPKAPPAPPVTSAVISLNGELMTVSLGASFPTAGATYDRVGSLFVLKSLTASTAKVAIAGGSYADGAPTLTLTVGKPVTLQNTADGTRYTLVLEPQGTQIPVSTTPATTTPAPPTTTTQSVVPTSPSG